MMCTATMAAARGEEETNHLAPFPFVQLPRLLAPVLLPFEPIKQPLCVLAQPVMRHGHLVFMEQQGAHEVVPRDMRVVAYQAVR